MADDIQDGSREPPSEVISDIISPELMVTAQEPLALQQARELDRKTRRQIFLDYNGMTGAVAIGNLDPNTEVKGFDAWVRDMRTTDGRRLKYPLREQMPRPSPSAPVRHLPASIKAYSGLVLVQLDVVPDNSQQKPKNPFSLMITDVEPLATIPESYLSRDGDNILLPESIYNAEVKRLESSMKVEFEKLTVELNKKKARLEGEIEAITESTSEKQGNLAALIDALDQAEQDSAILADAIERTSEDIDKLKKQKGRLMSEYEKMVRFASEKAEQLLALDLITQKQLDAIKGTSATPPESPSTLSWVDDLHSDYAKLADTVHAYLLQQSIIYPRWLVANFLTLLRSNDLIILSGLSGAGKTQIVRSFAEALGGVAHIMPVKPNWTGAEDLLGFFNPLQKTYVRTPFLEAILAAASDPSRLHLICLDEMNLARAEYYFADFLSAMEDRSCQPTIPLYPENEASHVQAEVRMLLACLQRRDKSSSTYVSGLDIETLLSGDSFTERLRDLFGTNAGESFPEFHSRIRRALATILDVPASITVPENIRFIGAINVDQTTYGLSPKILDRAHVIRFSNPLLYPLEEIQADSAARMGDDGRIAPVFVPANEFLPNREPYPKYDAEHPAAQWLTKLYKEYLVHLGMDVAFRTIRQSQHYWGLLSDVFTDEAEHMAVAKNLIVLQKILPKFTFDGKMRIRVGAESEPRERWEVVRSMEQDLQKDAESAIISPNMHQELHRVRLAAEASDRIFNYWA